LFTMYKIAYTLQVYIRLVHFNVHKTVTYMHFNAP